MGLIWTPFFYFLYHQYIQYPIIIHEPLVLFIPEFIASLIMTWSLQIFIMIYLPPLISTPLLTPFLIHHLKSVSWFSLLGLSSLLFVFLKRNFSHLFKQTIEVRREFQSFLNKFFAALCFLKTLLSLITLFPFCLFLIHQVIGGELQDRLIPIPYSKSTTDQAVREFYNCPVKLLSLYLTLYAWCIPSSKTSIQTPKKCCTFYLVILPWYPSST